MNRVPPDEGRRSAFDAERREFPTGALRAFVKDWERAGKERFRLDELLRYLGAELPVVRGEVPAAAAGVRRSKMEFSTLDLIRRYLTEEEEERLRELEAAATAIRHELTPDEQLRLVSRLSAGLLELVAERQQDETTA